jgi:glutamate-1-semialdehyde aminotransferase
MPNGVRHNPHDPVIEQSNAWYERARRVIPAGCQTLAKGPGQFVDGVAPKLLQRGRGARVWDVDGNEYLDLSMAVGPLSLGYCDPDVDRAIREQLEDGISFSLVHPLEVEVAEAVREMVPGVEMVRFSKTGADVTSAAVRLARAFTGRDKVLSCGYHGWHDWYIAVTDRHAGVPEATRDASYTFEYNDLEGLERALTDDVACVILEPVTFQQPSPTFLQGVRELCTRRGALLVFDEMWTGFRLALGGAQEHFDVRTDLATFSKAIANGMPLSVLTGKAEVMKLCERDVFFFTTFGGETLSLAAAKATLRKLRERRVPEHIAALGRRVHEGLSALLQELELPSVRSVGLPYRTMLGFDGAECSPLELKSFVQQELFRYGILWGGFHNFSLAHTEADVDYLLDAYREIFPQLKAAIAARSVASQLRGRPVEPVFRKTTKFHTRPKPAA